MDKFLQRGGSWVIMQFILIGAHGALSVVTRGALPAWSVLAVVGAIAIVAGLFIVRLAAQQLGDALTALPAPRRKGTLVQIGLYAHVRHPIYSGVLLLVLGWAIAWASALGLIWTAIVIAFFFAKARHEEVLLTAHYPDCAAYAAKTKRLIPGVL